MAASSGAMRSAGVRPPLAEAGLAGARLQGLPVLAFLLDDRAEFAGLRLLLEPHPKLADLHL